jgi:hypothetical protein
VEQSAWSEVTAAVRTAPYPVEVLPVDARRSVPLAEIVAFNEDVVRQLFPGSSPRR